MSDDYAMEAVRAALPEWPRLIGAQELSDITGLEMWQVYGAVAALRDTAEERPLVSKKGYRGGYAFTDDADAIRRFETSRWREVYTITTRTWNGVLATGMSSMPTAERKQLTRDYTRLMEDLEAHLSL